MPQLAFDEVILREKGNERRLSPEEWLEIPTLDQFDLIISKRVEFRMRGEVVKSSTAVRSAAAYREHRRDGES